MHSIVGILIMALAPLLFYVFLLFCCKNIFQKNDLASISKLDLVTSFVILVFVLFFSFIVISKNNYIYFWDHGREWRAALTLKDGLLVRPFQTLGEIYRSINNDDYNKLMPMLIVLPLYLINASFKVSVLIVEAFYMCPAIIIIALMIFKVLNSLNLKNIKFSVLVFFTSFTPILHYVVFDGFIDPPVLILVAVILLLSINIDYKVINKKKDVLLAIALVLVVLFRRDFAYFVVGYLTSQFVFAGIQLFECEDKDSKRRVIKGYMFNMMIIGAISLTILGLFFTKFLYRSVFNNFSLEYKAYDVTLYEKFARIPEVFGWIIIVAAVIAPIVYSWFNKYYFRIIVPLMVNIVITTWLLWRVLQMNYHQYYLIIIQVLVLACIGILGITQLIHYKHIICVVSVFMVLFTMINMSSMFLVLKINLPFKYLFTTKYYSPKVMNDINSINRLVDKLNQIGKMEPSSKFYTLASSTVLNQNIIASSKIPDILNAVPQMSQTSDVDLRDGFPTSFLDANFIIVGDPIQTHLPKGTQEVVTYLAHQVMDVDSYLGKNYAFVEDYDLDDGVKAKLYKKIHSLDRTVYNNLQTYFDSLYPNQSDKFHNRLIYPEPFFTNKIGESTCLTAKDGIMNSQFPMTDAIVSTGKGFLVYGPYKKIEHGIYTITFTLSLPENCRDNDIGFVDVYDGHILKPEIVRKDIKAGEEIIELRNVELAEDCESIEFRVYTEIAGVQFEKIMVTREN